MVGKRIGITRSIEVYRGIDSGTTKICVAFDVDGSHVTIGSKTPTLVGEYDPSDNTTYPASVKSLDVLVGIKGTLSPTAFKPSFDVEGVVGECNGALRGLTEYKTGTKVLVIRASNPD